MSLLSCHQIKDGSGTPPEVQGEDEDPVYLYNDFLLHLWIHRQEVLSCLPPHGSFHQLLAVIERGFLVELPGGVGAFQFIPNWRV